MSTAYLTPEETPTREELDRMAGPVLVEFGTDWCGICRALQPTVTRLTAQYPGIRHLKVEDGPGRPLGRSFRIKLWPSFIFLRDGVVLRQLVRPGPAELDEAFRALAGGAT